MKKKTKILAILFVLILLGVLGMEVAKLAELIQEEYQAVSSEIDHTESPGTTWEVLTEEILVSETESTEATEEEGRKETFQEII